MLSDMSSHDELIAFFAESLIMKDFNHPNVLGLTGVCFDAPGGCPYLILPFMINGSLKDYLKKQRVHVTDVDTCPKVSVVHYCTSCHVLLKHFFTSPLPAFQTYNIIGS